MLLALIPVMFTYSGWNAAAYVAEEVRSPAKNVPLALGLGTLTVIVIYLSLNALYPVRAAGRRAGVGARCAPHRYGGASGCSAPSAGSLLAAFSIVSIAASLSAMMIAGPRVYFAMARDGVFAAPAGRDPSEVSRAHACR